MPLGACTWDRRKHVHANELFTCTDTVLYLVVPSTVPPIPRSLRAARGIWRGTGAPPLFASRIGTARGGDAHWRHIPTGGSLPSQSSLREGHNHGTAHECRAEALERDSMRWRHMVLVLAGAAAVIWRTRYDPFPLPGDNPVLDLIAYHDPTLHAVIEAWHYGAPGASVLLAGLVSLSVWRVWFEPQPGGGQTRGELPEWPISSEDEAPSVVVGEVHHPVEATGDHAGPSWLVIPERGLYTGVLIFGAVGSGQDLSLHAPLCSTQILSWQAGPIPSAVPAGLSIGSQRRFLPLHTTGSCKEERTWRGLPGDRSGQSLAMESAG